MHQRLKLRMVLLSLYTPFMSAAFSKIVYTEELVEGMVHCMNNQECIGANRMCYHNKTTMHGTCICREGFEESSEPGRIGCVPLKRKRNSMLIKGHMCGEDKDCGPGESCMGKLPISRGFDKFRENRRTEWGICLNTMLLYDVNLSEEPKTGGGLRSSQTWPNDIFFRKPRVQHQYISFVEDMMLILFLICILVTLVTVHRASCYRQLQDARRNTPLRHILPIAEDQPPPYTDRQSDDVDGDPEMAEENENQPKRQAETPPPTYEEALYRNSVRLPYEDESILQDDVVNFPQTTAQAQEQAAILTESSDVHLFENNHFSQYENEGSSSSIQRRISIADGDLSSTPSQANTGATTEPAIKGLSGADNSDFPPESTPPDVSLAAYQPIANPVSYPDDAYFILTMDDSNASVAPLNPQPSSDIGSHMSAPMSPTQASATMALIRDSSAPSADGEDSADCGQAADDGCSQNDLSEYEEENLPIFQDHQDESCSGIDSTDKTIATPATCRNLDRGMTVSSSIDDIHQNDFDLNGVSARHANPQHQMIADRDFRSNKLVPSQCDVEIGNESFKINMEFSEDRNGATEVYTELDSKEPGRNEELSGIVILKDNRISELSV